MTAYRRHARPCMFLSAISIVLLLVATTAFAKPATLCVNSAGSSGCFSKIQDAINATGKSGSIINVAQDGYVENVTIPKIKVTINADMGTSIVGATSDPIFTIAAGANVTIKNLQIGDTFAPECIESHGKLTMQNVDVFLCTEGQRGAGIHQVGGQLTIADSAVEANTASENGGCLAMEGGQLNLTDVDFTNCTAGGDGGALWLSNTNASINEVGDEAHQPGSEIAHNTTAGSGGGIFASGGKITIEAANVTNNTADSGEGGAIQSTSSLTIVDSEFDDNSSQGSGGAVSTLAPGKLTVSNSSFIGNRSSADDGGAIGAASGFNLLDDTIFGNQAETNGGGISAHASGTISSLTIDGNTAVENGGGIDVVTGTVKITNTIIALNSAPMEFAQDCGGSFLSQDFNLIFDTAFCTISGKTDTNIVGQDPNLGAPEHFDVKLVQEPNQGSPVLGAGGNCPKMDEVLHERPKRRCDIGAFESP